ncbi:(2Fe-2S) ferredoxin domain-containing protein [Lunatimonas salinarum]|uniref:(2Fe-2S) ferredoxin domain-containing protein n=1 Tax=Lunatimonas salinarum TaxID=1774590 RepID=UPI001AE00DC5|nr:(2Fe-2S) ferredoxin domain-containing protein [Lunatimonas salinarum]
MGRYRKFVFVCTGSDCKKAGCKTLMKDLKQILSLDPHRGSFKLVKTKCMDFCKSGPVMVFENEVFKNGEIGKFKGKIQ